MQLISIQKVNLKTESQSRESEEELLLEDVFEYFTRWEQVHYRAIVLSLLPDKPRVV